MKFGSTWLVLAIALPSSAVWAAPQVKETIQAPRGWVKHKRASSDQILQLRIALPQSNFDVLEKHLLEVSDPFHSRYGAHLSKEEVEELVAPHPDSLTAVDKWLASHGVLDSARRSPAKDWVTISVPVGIAEEMLDTTYHVWTHVESGDSLIRTTRYSLPHDLHSHIELIQPTTVFSRVRSLRSTLHWSSSIDELDNQDLPAVFDAASGNYIDASCNKTITVSCLKQLYNAVGYNTSDKNGNKIGITGYIGSVANEADLQLFYQDQRPDAVNSSYTFVSVNGGSNNQSQPEPTDNEEADLDTQFAFGISHPTPGTFWSTGGSPPFNPDVHTPTNTNEPYTEWLDFVLSQDNLPQVISSSYGDDEQTVPEDFARRVCAGFAQLGARGVSLTFSSGDNGVGDGNPNPANQTCFTNDGRNATRFIPVFPASCPFVTSVGGTANIPETAVSRFFSGGGFSDYFSRPGYQAAAVEKYLGGLPKGLYEGLFNPDGRAIPDVSAQGDRFRIFFRLNPVLIGGTSASAPTFAAFVSMLNDARLSQGRPPLGFLNPMLYTLGLSGLNDITIGHNAGCGTPGFNATKGWDPVTGLGTPNFGKLKDIVLN